jgi:hypothetical protein
MGRKSDYVKRGLNVFLTRIDEAAFTRAMLEAFPDAEFLEQYWDGRKHAERRVEALHLADSLHVYVRIPHPGWIGDRSLWNPKLSAWMSGPDVSVEFFRSVWDWTLIRGAKWAWDPPILTGGRINASYRKDDPFDQDFVTTVLRRVLPSAARRFRSVNYVGHDALRWASEAPRRMIDGNLRPPQGWSFHKIRPAKRKYYEGLEAMRPESDPRPPPEMNE